MRLHTEINELHHFFEYTSLGIEVVSDGLQQISFGEYLVEHAVIDRFQLFKALQMQDRHPGVRIGECIAALGYLPYRQIEEHLAAWNKLSLVEA